MPNLYELLHEQGRETIDRYRRRRFGPPEPEPEQPETDDLLSGPITPDPDQGQRGGPPRRRDMNTLIRAAWRPDDPRYR